MNYQKQYADKINWKNSPDTSTPLNATNLNKMDNALWYMDTALYTISKAIGGGSSARGGIISNAGNNAFTTHVHQRTGESLADNELLILRSDVSGTGNSINVYTDSSSAVGFDLLDLDGESTSITVTTDSVVILMITDADTDYTAQVLAVIDTAGGVAYSGLGIGKKTGVSSNVIDTDIDLHRSPMAGDRLLVYFDEKITNPTGLKTYNNGIAVTSNLENATPLYINAGWNILEFKNDGLLYNNCWVRKQNIPVPSTLAGMSDTLIVSPSNDQLLVYDNGKWKNKKFVEANVGFSDTELKKIKVGDIVYDTDGLRDYSVSSIANNNITISVLNSNQFVMENIAINTGNHSGSSNGWNLVISDGLNPVSVALKNADGSPFADDIHENELLFVYVDTAGNIARVLGTAGTSDEVYSAFNLLSKSEVAESVPYLYRRSGGVVRDVALEKLKKVIGASVAWNQLFPSISNKSQYDVTATNNGDGTYTFNGTSTNRFQLLASSNVRFNQNDKVIFWCERISGSVNNRFELFFVATRLDTGTSVYPSLFITDSSGNVTGKSQIKNFEYDIQVQNMVLDSNVSSVTYNNFKVLPQVFNLTQMFGSTIADYIYSLEQATTGSGVAFFRALFPKVFYAYNTGALQSVKTSGKKCVGKNLFNANILSAWKYGTENIYSVSNDNVTVNRADSTSEASETQFFSFKAGTYTWSIQNGARMQIAWDGAKQIDTYTYDTKSVTFTLPTDKSNIHIKMLAQSYPYTIGHIQIEQGSTATAYEPYTEKTYSLSDVELRGLFKLDSNNNLYADGDEYTPDGNIKRKYGIVDLGSLSWTYRSEDDMIFSEAVADMKGNVPITSKANILCGIYLTVTREDMFRGDREISINAAAHPLICVNDSRYTDAATFKTAMNGVYLIYELATATTETTTPYTEVMLVDGDGTEEFLDSRDIPIPVGHESKYNQAIKGLPTAPTTDGNYKLRCTVSGGVPSYSWVSDT